MENATPKIGRPRCETAKSSILNATWHLLEEIGFAELTIEGVADRAEVGKTTVYRWWPNKAALVADTFHHFVNPRVHFPDTGHIGSDLELQMKELCKVLSTKRGRVLRALIGGGQSDPELLEAFRTQWMEPRRTEAREIIRRAIRRGQLRADLDPETVLDALYGPLYFRFLLGHAKLSPEFVQSLCSFVLTGISRDREEPSATSNVNKSGAEDPNAPLRSGRGY